MAFQKITETTYDKIKNKLPNYNNISDKNIPDDILSKVHSKTPEELETLVQQIIDGTYEGHIEFPYDANLFIENLKKYGVKGLYMGENQTLPE